MEEVKELRLELGWTPVLCSDEERYLYPSKPSSFLKKRYTEPVVYRWLILVKEKVTAVYYGEAENLAKRIDGYRSGHEGQQTNARIKKYFGSLPDGASVRLEILEVSPFFLNGTLVGKEDLCKKHVRCLFENILLTTHPPESELLNLSHSTQNKKNKRALAAIAKLPRVDQERIMVHLSALIEAKEAK